MIFQEAFEKFYDEFSVWLMDNNFVGNGDMLLRLFENASHFETFIAEKHPEIGELE